MVLEYWYANERLLRKVGDEGVDRHGFQAAAIDKQLDQLGGGLGAKVLHKGRLGFLLEEGGTAVSPRVSGDTRGCPKGCAKGVGDRASRFPVYSGARHGGPALAG